MLRPISRVHMCFLSSHEIEATALPNHYCRTESPSIAAVQNVSESKVWFTKRENDLADEVKDLLAAGLDIPSNRIMIDIRDGRRILIRRNFTVQSFLIDGESSIATAKAL